MASKLTTETTTQGTENILDRLQSNAVPLVKPFTPGNGAEIKSKFLGGEIENPKHSYPGLEDFTADEKISYLEGLRKQLSGQYSGEKGHAYDDAYRAYIDESISKLRMLEAAAKLQAEDDPVVRASLIEDFMQRNIELYGEPEMTIYQALVLETTQLADHAPEATKDIADELKRMLPEARESEPLFRPSQETIDWVKQATDIWYEGVLGHIEADKMTYTVNELRELFETVITEEFGEAAEGWTVELSRESTSIEVRAAEKKVLIPADRKPESNEKVRELVAHELGVHFMKAVSGNETDMPLLSIGLAKNIDSEEGLASMIGHLANGKYKDAGTGLYFAASLAYFEGKDFRSVHEIMWRRSLLETYQEGEDIDEQTIAAKDRAYNFVRRIFRGTDEAPWFKDLNYLAGNQVLWKYLEDIRGDDQQLAYLLMGKFDPTKVDHRRVFLESSSR